MEERKASAEDKTKETDRFYRELEKKHLVALWNVTSQLLPSEPKTKVQAHLWKGSELRDLAYRAADLVPINHAPSFQLASVLSDLVPEGVKDTCFPVDQGPIPVESNKVKILHDLHMFLSFQRVNFSSVSFVFASFE